MFNIRFNSNQNLRCFSLEMKKFRTHIAQLSCHQYAEQAKQHEISENFSKFLIFIRLIQNSKFYILYHILIIIRDRTRIDFVIIDFAHSRNDELISTWLFANCKTNHENENVIVANDCESLRYHRSLEYFDEQSTIHLFFSITRNDDENTKNLSKSHQMCHVEKSENICDYFFTQLKNRVWKRFLWKYRKKNFFKHDKIVVEKFELKINVMKKNVFRRR